MGDSISDQELRRRLASYNVVVPPVTDSTRKLLIKKLTKLESGDGTHNVASKIMPPPKLVNSTNGTNESIMISSSANANKPSQHIIFTDTDSPRKSARRRRQLKDPFDTSDSEVDAGTIGHSVLTKNLYRASSSPKSNETSLMNVSNWKNKTGEDSYVSPETNKSPHKKSQTPTEKLNTKLFDLKLRQTDNEPVTRKLQSNPVVESQTHADRAIQRWNEKLLKQAQSQNNESNASQNSRKNFQTALQRHKQNLYSKNIQYIIFLFIGLFVVILGLYFISVQPSSVVLPPGILNSLCGKKGLQGSNCVTEQEKIQRLYNVLISQVQDKYLKSQCDNSDIIPTINIQTLYEYISTHENIPPREIEELVELFKSIAKTYSDSPIGYDNSFKINTPPNLPFMCAAKNIFSNMFYLTTWLGIVGLSVIGLYFIICYITAKGEKYKLEVTQLVENTIDLLKERALNQPDESYLPIIHVRDHLIPFNERQEKSKIWAEVVQYFTESESRVRSEIQEIDGEDFQVWRWVQPMSPGL